jgi:CRP/FNR family transcriptional regulator, cyclic AMP receptor protein
VKFGSFFDYPTADQAEPAAFVLLKRWSDAQWRTLRAFSEQRRYRAGQIVISAGDADRSLYIVVEGALEVTVGRRHPRRVTVAPGSLIGEVAFFDGQPRGADVRAATDVELLRLRPEDVEVFAAKHPSLGRDLLMELGKLLALRLRHTQELLGT